MEHVKTTLLLSQNSLFEPKYFAQLSSDHDYSKKNTHILSLHEVRLELLHLYVTIPIQLIELISDLEKHENDSFSNAEVKRYTWNRELYSSLLHNTQRIYQLFQSTEITKETDRKEAIQHDTIDVKKQMAFIEERSQHILNETNRAEDADFEFGALPLPLPNNDLEVILTELLSNAARFSEKGSQIRVTTDIRDNAVRLVIKDSGVGMLETQVEEIQAAGISSSEIANGLGLIIVKLLVQQYNGKIEVFSIPCRETVISIRFPLNSELGHFNE